MERSLVACVPLGVGRMQWGQPLLRCWLCVQSILHGWTRAAVSAAQSAAYIFSNYHSLVSFDFCCVTAIFLFPTCVACPHIQWPCVFHLKFRQSFSKNMVLCVYAFILKCSTLLACSAYAGWDKQCRKLISCGYQALHLTEVFDLYPRTLCSIWELKR